MEARYSPDVPNASPATVSHPSTNRSTQSPVIPVSPKVHGRRGLPTATLVQAANDDMRLHQSVRECVKMSNLTHSAEVTMLVVALARPLYEPTVPKHQTVLRFFLLYHQTPQSSCPYCRG
ncbi:unnamed protein product [Hymenolepis diminuta]|uniref:Uncharacterized protein n=1 Tax=Hymenolepis diminuta TaxID=6216 RepID=A0A564YD82_HYMDI|nr:unnamed protein product [Hymenolepis diminuta]VUZ44553.1 unnamed protein product [Hymenolepis diminuta]VUZ54016.1 unnamed protein product [Hymenolepis diminuta]VUZ54358.1 unnamed protein product [Hymenolepis diminuta]